MILTDNSAAAWIGVVLCVFAPALFLWGILSFGKSFRVGIDEDKPGGLVSTGAFSISRNPLYVAFFMVLTGVFFSIIKPEVIRIGTTALKLTYK